MDHMDKGNRRRKAPPIFRDGKQSCSSSRHRRRSYGLSVINYPIVKLSARRYWQHGVVPDDSVVKSSDSGECITVISRRIARKHRSRARREREQVCASLIRRSMRRILRKCFESSASKERCRASLFLSHSRESLVPLEETNVARLISIAIENPSRLSGRDGYSLISAFNQSSMTSRITRLFAREFGVASCETFKREIQ